VIQAATSDLDGKLSGLQMIECYNRLRKHKQPYDDTLLRKKHRVIGQFDGASRNGFTNHRH